MIGIFKMQLIYATTPVGMDGIKAGHMLFYNFCFAEFSSTNYSGVCGGTSTVEQYKLLQKLVEVCKYAVLLLIVPSRCQLGF